MFCDDPLGDSDPNDWSVLSCLEYLKDRIQFTSDSKKRYLRRDHESIFESCNVKETFKRRDIVEFFESLDQKFDERDLERSFDRNGCKLLKKSGDFNTLKLSSNYAEKSTEPPQIDESVSNQRTYDKKTTSRQRNYTVTSPKLHSLPLDNPLIEDKDKEEVEDKDKEGIDNPFIEYEDEDEWDPANDLKIGDTNVSQLFRQYQNESLKITKTGGLLVESNVHEILSLSSLFFLFQDLTQIR
ncbi:11501_t:CDS:2 [Acaulospora morrowiae]|uniref:11501_t:CDS:1 n=1 Tax=Acaulospora morrowiae TaxID=94023 RepID=A0A9N8Z2V0_9GLOM|nr:11501_t:CDS:2 [Acaulospora morrowiae]